MVIMLGTALSRLVTIHCPHCGQAKRVERRPVAFRVCPRCHRHYPDPVAAKATRGKRRG
jgi:transposase-like protein